MAECKMHRRTAAAKMSAVVLVRPAIKPSATFGSGDGMLTGPSCAVSSAGASLGMETRRVTPRGHPFFSKSSALSWLCRLAVASMTSVLIRGLLHLQLPEPVSELDQRGGRGNTRVLHC